MDGSLQHRTTRVMPGILTQIRQGQRMRGCPPPPPPPPEICAEHPDLQGEANTGAYEPVATTHSDPTGGFHNSSSTLRTAGTGQQTTLSPTSLNVCVTEGGNSGTNTAAMLRVTGPHTA